MLRAQPLVLVVEDDPRVAAYLDRALAQAGYCVEHAPDGIAALQAAAAHNPDLLVLDVGLPGLDGLEVARRLRASSSVPILILTARDGVSERIRGFDAGADDFLAKPFAIDELHARVRALLRRSTLNSAEARKGVLEYADMRVDLDRREVQRAGRTVNVRHRAFELLVYFLRHPERVLSRRDLIEDVWGYEYLGDSNIVEVTIGHLRRALEAHGEPRLLQTVRPVGYILRSSPRAQTQRDGEPRGLGGVR